MSPEVIASLVAIWVVMLLPAATLVGTDIGSMLAAALLGAVLVSWAAEAELFIGGSFQLWLVVLALCANALALAAWLTRRHPSLTGCQSAVVSRPVRRQTFRLHAWARWSSIGPLTSYALPLLVATTLPILLLGAKYVTHDANAIWILHARWILAGHQAYLSSLHNPAYSFSNPSYPPLISAVMALPGVVSPGPTALDAVSVVAMLNGVALGLVALALLKLASSTSAVQSSASLLSVTVVLFGFGADGIYSAGGDADLFWAACAVAGVLFGLVLPQSRNHLAIALVCFLAASLSKSEASVAATATVALVAWRYATLRPQGRFGHGRSRLAELARASVSRKHFRQHLPICALWIPAVLGMSGLGWLFAMHALGVPNRFFEPPLSGQSLSYRVATASVALVPYLPLVAAAAASDLFATLRWRSWRAQVGLGSPLLLWIVVALYMVGLLTTYAIGSLPIVGWLGSSLSRAMIFVQLAVASEIAASSILVGRLLRGGEEERTGGVKGSGIRSTRQ